MATNTELSIDIMRHIQRTLNNMIESHGEITINNKTIWDGYLHQMPNEVWRGILETLHELAQQQPQLFSMHHISAVGEGLYALNKFDQYYDQVLDMKNRHLDHKRIAWKCFMTVREVMNAAMDIDLPNSNHSRVKNTFQAIFE